MGKDIPVTLSDEEIDRMHQEEIDLLENDTSWMERYRLNKNGKGSSSAQHNNTTTQSRGRAKKT